MSRRRFQKGCLFGREGNWVGRWRVDVVDLNGVTTRKLRYETLGTKKDYPTKRLAERELQRRLVVVNALGYRAHPQITFETFAEKWKSSVLVNLKASTRSAISALRKHLVPCLGSCTLSNLQGEQVQVFITGVPVSPKTKKNLVAYLRMMWVTASQGDVGQKAKRPKDPELIKAQRKATGA